jgi:hypothetical protein
MLEPREEDIDRITELFHRVLKGEIPQPLVLPKDYPENEIRQVAEYANRFATEYRALADAMRRMTCGLPSDTVQSSGFMVSERVPIEGGRQSLEGIPPWVRTPGLR